MPPLDQNYRDRNLKRWPGRERPLPRQHHLRALPLRALPRLNGSRYPTNTARFKPIHSHFHMKTEGTRGPQYPEKLPLEKFLDIKERLPPPHNARRGSRRPPTGTRRGGDERTPPSSCASKQGRRRHLLHHGREHRRVKAREKFPNIKERFTSIHSHSRLKGEKTVGPQHSEKLPNVKVRFQPRSSPA